MLKGERESGAVVPLSCRFSLFLQLAAVGKKRLAAQFLGMFGLSSSKQTIEFCSRFFFLKEKPTEYFILLRGQLEVKYKVNVKFWIIILNLNFKIK